MMKKNILIINTGGTISCVKTKNGYHPQKNYVKQMLQQSDSFHHPDMPLFDVKEYDPLIDSSNVGVSLWNKIAQDISDNYHLFDGFIILHGTDTMAYTASILSFMLENLNKPVILTGSQIPLSEVRNDAVNNITTALWLCTHQAFPEVAIYFNGYLLRGNRARKLSAQRFRAFESPNYPHLATIGIDIQLQHALILPEPEKSFQLQPIQPQFIANFRLFPGFASDVLEHILEQPLAGLILETYGSGNAPNDNPGFLDRLKKASKRGIIIVNCTQCLHGKVKMHQYATGNSLKKAGLISGYDMTPEAAHCKLLYLLSKNLDSQRIKTLMQTNLCGELSPKKIFKTG